MQLLLPDPTSPSHEFSTSCPMFLYFNNPLSLLYMPQRGRFIHWSMAELPGAKSLNQKP